MRAETPLFRNAVFVSPNGRSTSARMLASPPCLRGRRGRVQDQHVDLRDARRIGRHCGVGRRECPGGSVRHDDKGGSTGTGSSGVYREYRAKRAKRAIALRFRAAAGARAGAGTHPDRGPRVAGCARQPAPAEAAGCLCASDKPTDCGDGGGIDARSSVR